MPSLERRVLGANLIRYLHPEEIQLIRNGNGLEILIDGLQEPVGRVCKAFPQTKPDLYIGLMDPDGHEIGMIKDPATLDPASRDLLEEMLKALYFVPRIQEIRSVVSMGTGKLWEVLTDDGERRFRIQDRDALDGSEAPAITIRDEHGRRYRIEDFWELDRESQDHMRDLLPDKVLRARYGRGRGHRHGHGHSHSGGGMVSTFR